MKLQNNGQGRWLFLGGLVLAGVFGVCPRYAQLLRLTIFQFHCQPKEEKIGLLSSTTICLPSSG